MPQGGMRRIKYKSEVGQSIGVMFRSGDWEAVAEKIADAEHRVRKSPEGEGGGVREICKILGVSHQTYYSWSRNTHVARHLAERRFRENQATDEDIQHVMYALDLMLTEARHSIRHACLEMGVDTLTWTLWVSIGKNLAQRTDLWQGPGNTHASEESPRRGS